ncbi:pentapeptide repeat-containing protein [Nostocales cyanobacterium LEGE 12452]|nr:pentapeptide repeat-containing protein [Nostocales cyanobacterium LEGE 12452]
MPQDNSCQNLRGRSFKDQDLAGANFSYTDIRGADFSGAKLNCWDGSTWRGQISAPCQNSDRSR